MAAVSAPQDVDYSQYLTDPARTIKSVEDRSEPRLFTVVTFDDDSQYVVLPDHLVDRFCGYLYLREKLSGDSTLRPAENRLYWDGKNVQYLSRYCGSTKVDLFKSLTQITPLADIGFKDLVNLRKKDDVVYVFDTEKMSFDPTVHAEINGFRKVHDAALAALKARDSTPKED